MYAANHDRDAVLNSFENANQLLSIFREVRKRPEDIKAGALFLRFQEKEGDQGGLSIEKRGFFGRILVWMRGKPQYDFGKNITKLREQFIKTFHGMSSVPLGPRLEEEISLCARYYQQMLQRYAERHCKQEERDGFVQQHSLYAILKQQYEADESNQDPVKQFLAQNVMMFIRERWIGDVSQELQQREDEFLLELQKFSNLGSLAQAIIGVQNRINALKGTVPEQMMSKFQALEKMIQGLTVPGTLGDDVGYGIRDFIDDFERRANGALSALSAFDNDLKLYSQEQSEKEIRGDLSDQCKKVSEECAALLSRMERVNKRAQRLEVSTLDISPLRSVSPKLPDEMTKLDSAKSQETRDSILQFQLILDQQRKLLEQKEEEVQRVAEKSRDAIVLRAKALIEQSEGVNLEERARTKLLGLTEKEREESSLQEDGDSLDEIEKQIQIQKTALQRRLDTTSARLAQLSDGISKLKVDSLALISREQELQIQEKKAPDLHRLVEALEGEVGKAQQEASASLKKPTAMYSDQIEQQATQMESSFKELESRARNLSEALNVQNESLQQRREAVRASATEFLRSSEELSLQEKRLNEVAARLGVDPREITEAQKTLQEFSEKVRPFQGKFSFERITEGETLLQRAKGELSAQQQMVQKLSTQFEAQLAKMRAQRQHLLETGEKTKAVLKQALTHASPPFAEEIARIDQEIEKSLQLIADDTSVTQQSLDAAERKITEYNKRASELSRNIAVLSQLRQKNKSRLAAVSEWAAKHSDPLAREVVVRTEKMVEEFASLLESSKEIEMLVAEDRKLSNQCSPESLDAALEQEREGELLLAKGRALVSQCKKLEERFSVVQPIVEMLDGGSIRLYETVSQEVTSSRKNLEGRLGGKTLDQRLIDDTTAHLSMWEESLRKIVQSSWEAWEASIQTLLKAAEACGLTKMVPVLSHEEFLKLTPEEAQAYFDQIAKLRILIAKYGKDLKKIQDFLGKGFFTSEDKRKTGRSELALAEYCLGCEAMKLLEAGKTVGDVIRYFSTVKQDVLDRSNMAGASFVGFRDKRITIVRSKFSLIEKQKEFLSREDERVVESRKKELDAIERRTRLGASFGSKSYVPAYDVDRTDEPERLMKAILENERRVDVIEIEMDALLLKSQYTHLKRALESLDGHDSVKRDLQKCLEEVTSLLSKIAGARPIDIKAQARHLLEMKQSLRKALIEDKINPLFYTGIIGSR